MSKSTTPFELVVQIVRETEKAYLVTQGLKSSRGELIKHWLPKSQCTFPDGDPEIDATLPIELPEWLAIEKGLV